MGNRSSVPWGLSRQYQEATTRFQKRRVDGFEAFKQRVDLPTLLEDPRCSVKAKSTDELKAELKKISDWCLTTLKFNLSEGKVNAYTVLCAYVIKMLEVNEKINAVTEVITEAFEHAESLDQKYATLPKPQLFGIPFSVKSNFYMEGYDVTVGCAKLLDQKKEDECPLVTHMKNLGGIPFVLTNVPQGLLSFVSSNPLYGTTCNPYNTSRTAGGSSGGEAALLAAGGAAFGIGSDLAGSLRIPAAFCGVTTLKPTQDRFVVTHTHGGVPGRGRLGLSFGFFTRNVEDNSFLLRLTIGEESYRKLVPQSAPAPLRKLAPAKLRIGYFTNDGFCPSVPSNGDVVMDTVRELKRLGHSAVEFKIPRVNDAAALFFKNVMPDGGSYMVDMYRNENIDKNMRRFVYMLRMPSFVRWIAAKLVGTKSPQLGIVAGSYVSTIEELRYAQELTDDYKLEFIKHWQDMKIDVLLCPAFPIPAPEHKYPQELAPAVFSTGIWNMLDFPAGVLKCGTVTEDEVTQLNNPQTYPINNNYYLKQQKTAAEGSVGLPLSLQVVGLPNDEERCLQVMEVVESIWKNNMKAMPVKKEELLMKKEDEQSLLIKRPSKELLNKNKN